MEVVVVSLVNRGIDLSLEARSFKAGFSNVKTCSIEDICSTKNTFKGSLNLKSNGGIDRL